MQEIEINKIPAVIWNEKSDKVFIAVHGDMSNKKDDIIEEFASLMNGRGYQVLSFDLPEHGSRKDGVLCKVEECIDELNVIMEYAKEHWNEINLFAVSMGAYFSLMAYQKEEFNKILFLSPVLSMQDIINSMMVGFNISEADLKEKEVIELPIGKTLYWDYYSYVKK